MRPGGEALKRLYEDEGLSLAEIGKMYGVTGQAVRNWLIAAGIERRQKPNEKYPGEAEMRRLYLDEKKSLRQIAAELDTFIPVVSRWLKRAGIQSRSISEATSMAQKGRPISEAHKEALRKNIAIARTKVTAASREKHRQKMLGREPPNKGKPMHENARAALKAYWADPENRRKASERLMGENAPWWKGGVKSEDARRLDRSEWKALRQVVYERDNWTCADCGGRCLNTKDSRSKPKLKIQAHHILPRRYGGLDELENLVTLCMSCHHKRERAYVPDAV